jgi:tetratricopeptide (TPR) repeat protein
MNDITETNMKKISYIILTAFLTSCSTNQKTNNETKDLQFNVAGKVEAMPSFQNGLRLLHNFEYVDAAEAFIEAQRIDPKFTMAYWGEAMTYNHTVWALLDIDKARGALNKLGKTKDERVAKASSQLEKDFITSIEILYGEGTKQEREKQYSKFLSQMHQDYEAETEVAAFYALSLLGLKSGWSEMEDYNFQAEKIARQILVSNPIHPGALHYLIHSDDHPEYAAQALAAARDYAKVASYAGHALHMPSHIYLALGMWPDVVRTNEISWQASVDRKNKKKLPNDELDYHSHWWLSYGYLQQGRFKDAEKIVNSQARLTNELASPDARFHLLRMKGHYLIETLDWKNQIANLEIQTDDLSLVIRSTNNYINASKAFYSKDSKSLNTLIEEMEKDIAKGKQWKSENENITVCGVTAFVDQIPSGGEISSSEILLGQLKGMSAWLKNDLANAEKLLLQVAEKSNGYLFGPPRIVKPTQELVGEFYLAINKPDEAYKQFQLALKVAPNRILSLKGQLDALKKIGDNQKFNELENNLNELLKFSDERNTKI